MFTWLWNVVLFLACLLDCAGGIAVTPTMSIVLASTLSDGVMETWGVPGRPRGRPAQPGLACLAALTRLVGGFFLFPGLAPLLTGF